VKWHSSIRECSAWDRWCGGQFQLSTVVSCQPGHHCQY